MMDEYQRDAAGNDRCDLIRRECPGCGNHYLSNEWGGVCAECGCREPEDVEPPSRGRLLSWILISEAVLNANPHAPAAAVSGLRSQVKDWRAQMRRLWWRARFDAVRRWWRAMVAHMDGREA